MEHPRRTLVVLASGNPGKVREVREILSRLPAEVCAPDAVGPVDFPEEGGDYAENALAKARAVAEQLGVLAIADDSGLEVDALDGAPGPFSARYGGPDLDDAARVRTLLAALEGVSPPARTARFVCLAALATPSGDVFTRRGTCEGEILLEPRGGGGFGYDPIFRALSESASMAELAAARKNELSHRANAFRALEADLRACLHRQSR